MRRWWRVSRRKISELPRRQRLVERERSIKRIRHGPTTESETEFFIGGPNNRRKMCRPIKFGEQWHWLVNGFFVSTLKIDLSQWHQSDQRPTNISSKVREVWCVTFSTSLWSDSRNILLAPPLSHRSRGAECLSFPRKIQPNSWKISLQNKVLVTWPPGKVGEKKNGTTAEGHSSDTHHAGDSQRERAASCVIWSITSRDLALAFPFSFEFFFFWNSTANDWWNGPPRDHQLRSIQLKLNLKFLWGTDVSRRHRPVRWT